MLPRWRPFLTLTSCWILRCSCWGRNRTGSSSVQAEPTSPRAANHQQKFSVPPGRGTCPARSLQEQRQTTPERPSRYPGTIPSGRSLLSHHQVHPASKQNAVGGSREGTRGRQSGFLQNWDSALSPEGQDFVNRGWEQPDMRMWASESKDGTIPSRRMGFCHLLTSTGIQKVTAAFITLFNTNACCVWCLQAQAK